MSMLLNIDIYILYIIFYIHYIEHYIYTHYMYFNMRYVCIWHVYNIYIYTIYIYCIYIYIVYTIHIYIYYTHRCCSIPYVPKANAVWLGIDVTYNTEILLINYVTYPADSMGFDGI